MAELDKLVVKIEADLKDLKRGMAQANKTVGKSSRGMKKSMGGLNGVVNKVKANFGKLAAVMAIGFGGKKIADVSASFEDLQLTLNTVFKTAESGEAAMSFILEFAQKTPFDIQTLTKSFIQLGGAGIKPTEKLLTTLGDAASATTNRLQTFEALTRIVTRAVGGGLGLEELEQLVSAGIPVYKILNDEIGVTRTEISELGQSAEGAKIIMDALMTGLDKEFGGGMQKASKNLSVAFSNLGIASTQFIKIIGDEFNDSLTALANSLSTLLGLLEPLGVLFGMLVDVITFVARTLVETLNVAIIETTKGFHFLGETLADFNEFMFGALRPTQEAKDALAELEKTLGKNITPMATAAAKLKAMTAAQELLNAPMAEGQLLLKQMNDELERTGGLEAELEMKKIEDQTKAVKDIFDSAGDSIADAFGKSIVSGESFRQSMLDIFQTIVSSIISLIVKLIILEPILERVRKAIKGTQGQGVGSQLFAAGSALFGFAGGGTVQPNTPYMVGERGAEMFVSNTGGQIIPNDRLGGGGGGGIIIEQNLNFATGVSQTVRAEIMNMLPAIRQNTLSAVQDARLRGGTFAKDFGA
tara:strand:+ start:631 stop:2388 length:1758 start_codon:yes stop_codon:yes gene_type:complete